MKDMTYYRRNKEVIAPENCYNVTRFISVTQYLHHITHFLCRECLAQLTEISLTHTYLSRIKFSPFCRDLILPETSVVFTSHTNHVPRLWEVFRLPGYKDLNIYLQPSRLDVP